MFCSKCGMKLTEDSRFCPECGIKISSEIEIVKAKAETQKISQNNKELDLKEWGMSHVLTEKESGTRIKPFSLFNLFKEVCSEIKDKQNPEKWTTREQKESEDNALREKFFGRADKKLIDIVYYGKNSDIDENDFKKIIDNEKIISGELIDYFPFVITSSIENKNGILFATSKGIAIIVQSKSTGSGIYAAAGLDAAGAIGAAIGAGFRSTQRTKNYSKAQLSLIEKCQRYPVSLIAKCYPKLGDYPDGMFFPYQFIDKIIFDLNNGCVQITNRIFSDEIIYIHKDNLIDLIKIFR